MVKRAKLASVALGAVLLFGSTGIAEAGHWSENKCRNKIEKEQREVRRAEWRYGPYSPKAQHERFELNRILDRCSYYGNDRYRWNGDHDRDDRYRDRYRDRDDRWRH